MPTRHAPATATTPASLQLLSRAAFLATTGLVLVVPLVFSSAAFDMFRGPKSALAFACWSLLAATAAGLAGRRAFTDVWQLPPFAVVAAGLLGAPLSGQTGLVLAALVPLAVAAVGFAALRTLDDEHRARLAGFVVLGGVAVAAVTVAFTVPALRPDVWALLGDLDGRFARIGTLGNPGDVGVFLVVPCLLAASLALSDTAHRHRWSGAAVVLAAGVVFSETLTALVALAAGAAVLAWPRLRPRARWIGIGGGLLLLAVLAVATPLRGRIVGAVDEARRFGWAGVGSFRLAGWSAALAMTSAHPATGVGFDRFEANSFTALAPEIRAERGRYLGLVTAFGEAHSEPLQYLAETGLVGVLLLAAAVTLALRRGTRATPPAPARNALLVAAGILAATQFPLHQAAIAGQWAVVAALLLPRLDPRRTPVPRLAVAALALLAAGGASLAWLYHREGVGMQQARLFVASSATADSGTRRVLARRAWENLGRVLRLRAGDWRADLVLGNLAFAAGEPGEAVRHFSAALARSERPETWFDVGIARIAAGDRAGGIAALASAAELNPAILKELKDRDVARAVRTVLDARGFGARFPWIYAGTLAE